MRPVSPYILWLPSWYPNRAGPYDGDFIQRHARAVAQFFPLHVVHVFCDTNHTVTNDISIETFTDGNLTETIIYYAPLKTRSAVLNRFLSHKKLLKIYRQELQIIFSREGLPELVHVHCAYKAGLPARWLRKKFGLSYLLTEHWTYFLDEARPGFKSLSPVIQRLISSIIRDAERVVPASEYLSRAIQRRWPTNIYEVVPNVVDTSIFFPAEKEIEEMLRLVHISSLNYQKDPESLFFATGRLIKKGIAAQLDIFGPVTGTVKRLIKENNIEPNVILHGEHPQPYLAKVLQQADGLILYSRFETFGCVIIEANACGVPVIVPDTPLMHELVQDGVNGILVPPGNAEALAEALIKFSASRFQFNRKGIAAGAATYSFENIGKRYAAIYNRMLPP